MKFWVDLHIHSCLSPCAEEEMTPNNIVNMALIKGLDIIAVTDHNSARNVEAIMETGKREGLLVVPGMELCTSEEVHLLCFFPSLKQVLDFERIVYESLPPIRNREDIFGAQIIMNSSDQEIGREDRLLSSASGLDIETALGLVRGLGGVVIPSHIDRESFSMLNTLGTIPENYDFKFLEYSQNCQLNSLLEKHPELSIHPSLRSSDAHFLCNILEQEFILELTEKSIKAVLNLLK